MFGVSATSTHTNWWAFGSGGIVSFALISGTPYIIHTFLNNTGNTFKINRPIEVEYFVVGGGGGGGSNNLGGGGGGGEIYTGSWTPTVAGIPYAITVGDGGPGGEPPDYSSIAGRGSNGYPSYITDPTHTETPVDPPNTIGVFAYAYGGGGGGTDRDNVSVDPVRNGKDGASGGGGGGGGPIYGPGVGGTAIHGGQNGGDGPGGGGGGWTTAGAGGSAGTGGDGLLSDFNGISDYYYGGGGGGSGGPGPTGLGIVGGLGGLGGGGDGWRVGPLISSHNGTAGTDGTGGGGGGGSRTINDGSLGIGGQPGGSGIVMLRYKFL